MDIGSCKLNGKVTLGIIYRFEFCHMTNVDDIVENFYKLKGVMLRKNTI